MKRIKLIFLILTFNAMIGNSAFAQPSTQAIIDLQGGNDTICAYMISLAESARRIPTGLMLAIAQVESGRYTPGRPLAEPWPWTVSSAQAKERSKFYETQKESLNMIEDLQNDGITNIDVGCMQVNLFYHGRGFNSLAEAIDPINNVAYATEFLNLLFNRYENWGEAIKYYHSSDPTKNNYYLEKVTAAYQRINQDPSSSALRELRNALSKKNTPPLPPSADSEELLAKNAVDFAEELRRRISTLNDEEADQQNADGARGFTEELRIWDQWQSTSNVGNISGKDPDYYIDVLDNTFQKITE